MTPLRQLFHCSCGSCGDPVWYDMQNIHTFVCFNVQMLRHMITHVKNCVITSKARASRATEVSKKCYEEKGKPTGAKPDRFVVTAIGCVISWIFSR